MVPVDQLSLVTTETRDGRVTANIVTVAPEVSGRVVELLVAENQNIETGDVVFRIDPASMRSRCRTRKPASLPRTRSASSARARPIVDDSDLERHLGRGPRERRAQRRGGRGILRQAEPSWRGPGSISRADDHSFASTRYVPNRHVGYRRLRDGRTAHACHRRPTSFRVDGLFRGDEAGPGFVRRTSARVYLMRGGPPLTGRVASIARAIGDIDSPTGPSCC